MSRRRPASRSRTPRRARARSSRRRAPARRTPSRPRARRCAPRSVTIPSTSMPSSSKRSRECSSRYWSGSVPISRSRAPVRRRISGHARSSTGSPLRASWRPMKTTWCSRLSASACSGMTTPFGIDLEPGRRASAAADSAAIRETAMRASIAVDQEAPRTAAASRIQPRSPAACQVATIGQRA